MYPDNHRRFNNISSYSKWDVPDEYFDFQKSVDLKEEDLINSSILAMIINNINYGGYIDRQVMSESFIKTGDGYWAKPDNLDDDSLCFNMTIKKINNSLLRQLCLCERLGIMIRHGELKKFEKFQSLIDKFITNECLRKELVNYYKETKLRHERPDMNMQAILREISNTPAKAILDSILEQHRGKVIYVDCWATWCSPCRGEIPHSKELMVKLKKSPVSFIFLCFDSDRKKWIQLISEAKLGGVHYFVPEEAGKYLKNIFSITGYPTYLIFDKNGNLISTNAPRPSNQTKLLEEITVLLKE